MIKVESLKKAFGPKQAVNGISFSVERGEILGFLGPNGAGKSTTMRMITGYIPPDEGSVHIGSHNMLEDPLPAKKLIGYLPENAPSYNDMTVHGFLEFAAELRGLNGEARKKAVSGAIDMCFLESVMHQSVDTLSKGYRHRTSLAQALLHDPEVLVLDEPTDGLDPNQKHEIRTLIKRMGERKAIVFSTHILEEVEAVCTRAIIIDRGQIVANGTPQQLKARSRNAGAVTLTVRNNNADSMKEKLTSLAGVEQAQLVFDDAVKIIMRAYPAEGATGIAERIGELARREGWALEELHTEEGRMDEVFRAITLPETVKGKKQ